MLGGEARAVRLVCCLFCDLSASKNRWFDEQIDSRWMSGLVGASRGMGMDDPELSSPASLQVLRHRPALGGCSILETLTALLATTTDIG